MAEFGVILTAATIAILIAEFFHRRRGAFPSYGWFGLVSLASAEWLMFRGIEPVATFFTPIAWSSYILIADAAVYSLSGRSRLRRAPRAFLRMAAFSIPLWLIFELYNLRLNNWTYIGVPRFWPWGLIGYAWSFATITPAIFVTADLILAFLPPCEGKPWRISEAARKRLTIAGAICVALPWIAPYRIAGYLFFLVWVGFILLLDPLNFRLGLPSFIGDFNRGSRARFFAFLLAGWVCGWLWEFWNYWSAAKWHYTFPMFQNIKIFEMPAPGYLGFPPFALECYAMYVATFGMFRNRKRSRP